MLHYGLLLLNSSYGFSIAIATLLGLKSALHDRDLKTLTPSEIFSNLGNVLNGYSFGFIWIFEGQLEDPRVTCGASDFRAATEANRVLRSVRPLADGVIAQGSNPYGNMAPLDTPLI